MRLVVVIAVMLLSGCAQSGTPAWPFGPSGSPTSTSTEVGSASSHASSTPDSSMPTSAPPSDCGPSTTPGGRAASPSPLWATLEDIHGRVRNSVGIVLVDWQGQIANPAPTFMLRPSANFAYPVTATLHANGARLMFDQPSATGASGPSKQLTFASAAPQPFRLSIFPDHAGGDEDYTLNVTLAPRSGSSVSFEVPIHVIDQDTPWPDDFHVSLDFTKDQTGFFANASHRAVLQAVADDWGYFFDGGGLDPVTAGTEETWIWNPTGFQPGNGYFVNNSATYTGYLLYVYGIHSSEQRSGGEASHAGGTQSRGGVAEPTKRSGALEVETAGNYNALGWRSSTDDAGWADSSNLGDEVNDLYSIAHHEMGHALAFNGAHPAFAAAKSAGSISSDAVRAYYGGNLSIDGTDHFAGAIDPLSGYGAFGNEYYTLMPMARWLPTRLDLLAAEAVGHPLRSTSAFQSLSARDQWLPGACVGKAYSHALVGAGGVPAYDWSIESGTLPAGLTLDWTTGIISGSPTAPGMAELTVRLRDANPAEAGVQFHVHLTVT